MKNLFGIGSALALALAAGFLAAMPWGCGATRSETQTSQTPSSPSPTNLNRAVVIARVDLSDADVAKLPADFVVKAATVGWNRVAGGFEKQGNASDVEVQAGDYTTRTDADGTFTLPSGRAAGPVNLRIGEQVLTLKADATRSAGGERAWSLSVPYTCCAEDENHVSCCDSGTAEGMSRGEPMDGRCNDYNGWWSDGGNYAKSDLRAYRNFVQSDCDRAFFVAGCWQDHYRGGCWAVHGQGGCSRVIKHSADYHKHNFPN